MRVITIANQKGGAGKSTTALALADYLTHKYKKRVLLIDADMQGNVTDTCRGVIENQATLFDLVLDKNPCSWEEAIQKTAFGDLVASDLLLENVHKLVPDDESAYLLLKKRIDQLPEKQYDYVIIDTNPQLNPLLYMALAASDEVVIPMQVARYSVQGLSLMTSTIHKVKAINPGLRIGGLLLVMADTDTKQYQNSVKELRIVAEQIGTKVYKTAIRFSKACASAQAERIPLSTYKQRNNAARDYENFTEEIVNERR